VLRYEYELGKAADILVRDLFCLQRGETFVVTADTEIVRRLRTYAFGGLNPCDQLEE